MKRKILIGILLIACLVKIIKENKELVLLVSLLTICTMYMIFGYNFSYLGVKGLINL